MTRTERQKISVDKFSKSGGWGSIIGCVGYGKTKCALDAIERINNKKGYSIFVGVIVPTLNLQKQWEEKIEHRKISNVIVHTIQSFNSSSEVVVNNFWIYDEIDLYLIGETFKLIQEKTKGEFKLGLTGTLTEETRGILNRILPIVDEISTKEARSNGWVAGLYEFNYMVELSKEEKEGYETLKLNNNIKYSVFQYDSEYFRWSQARVKDAYFPSRGESTPSLQPGAQFVVRKTQPIISDKGEIFKDYEEVPEGTILLKGEVLYLFVHNLAKELSESFRTIKKMMQSFPSCLNAAKEVIEHLDKKTIVFGESNSSATNLNSMLNNSSVFHSAIETKVIAIKKEKSYKTQAAADRNAIKLKGGAFMRGDEWIVSYPSVKKITKEKQREEIINNLKTGDITTLVSSKCFVVGLDVEGVEVGINLSTTKKSTTHEQKKGRAGRKEGDKVAIFVNIIPNNTNAIYSFTEAQSDAIEEIKYVRNVQEITIE